MSSSSSLGAGRSSHDHPTADRSPYHLHQHQHQHHHHQQQQQRQQQEQQNLQHHQHPSPHRHQPEEQLRTPSLSQVPSEPASRIPSTNHSESRIQPSRPSLGSSSNDGGGGGGIGFKQNNKGSSSSKSNFSKRLSLKRPDTASTTSSFSSASADLRNSPSSSSHAYASASPSSSTSSVASTLAPHSARSPNSARIGRSFEALLASDETYVLQETVDIAKNPHDRLRERESEQPMFSSSSSSSSLSSGKRVVLGKKPKWEEEQVYDYNRLTASATTGRAKLMYDDEDIDFVRTPTLNSTPRLPSQPIRPPKAVDRSASPSVAPSSRRPSASRAGGQGRLSPSAPRDFDDLDLTDDEKDRRRSMLRTGGTASSPDLKTLVSRKAQAAQSTTFSSADGSHANNVDPSQKGGLTSPPSSSSAKNSTLSSSGSDPPQARRSQTSSSGASSGPLASSETGAGAFYSQASSNGHGRSNGDSSASRPRSRTYGTQDAGKPYSAPRPNGHQAVKFPIRHNVEVEADRETQASGSSSISASKLGLGESVSLADEVSMNSPNPADSMNGGGTFRERMKKTSGFLKKFRGDGASAERRDRAKREKASKGQAVGPSSARNASTKSLVRKESHTSLGSEDGSTLTHGSHSSAGGSGRHTQGFVSSGEVPVPSIPPRYARSRVPAQGLGSAPPSSDPPAPTASESSSSGGHANGLGPPPPPAKARSSSRVPSAPAEVSAPSSSTSAISLPQRSSSHGNERRGDSQLAASDSSSTGGELRLALKNWEHEMDDALKGAAQDLEKKTEFKPKAAWGPSPRLPDLDLVRLKERNGSFMGDEDDVVIPTSKRQSGGTGGSNSLPSTPTPDYLGRTAQKERTLGAAAAQRSATYGYSGDRRAKMNAAANFDHDRGQSPREAAGLGIGIPRRGDNHSDPSNNPSALLGLQRTNTSASAVSEPSASSSSRYDRDARREFGEANISPSPKLPVHHAASPLMVNDNEFLPRPHSADDTPKSSRRGSNDSSRHVFQPKLKSRRGTQSGASLASVKSFETAVEGSKTPGLENKSSFFYDSVTGMDAQQDPLWMDKSISGDASFQEPSSPSRKGDDPDTDGADEYIEPEQSIRLITRPTNGFGEIVEDLATPTDAPTMRVEDLETGRLTPSHLAGGSVRGGSGLETITEGTRPRDASTTKALKSLQPNDRRGNRVSMQASTPGSNGAAASPAASVGSWKVSPAAGKQSFDAASSSAHDHDYAGSAGGHSSSGERGTELATRCWNEDESFLRKEKIAEWLGGIGLVNKAARTAYFSHFDFSGLRVDIAFRKLCDKLFLKAETQQVDRILNAFSQRYYECNRDSILTSPDIVHSIVFSLLLLNTDLHVADIQDRMTRAQFTRNTLAAIQEQQAIEAATPSHLQIDDGRSSYSANADANSNQSMDIVREGAVTPSGSGSTVGLAAHGSMSTRSRPSRSGSIQSHVSSTRTTTANDHSPSPSHSPSHNVSADEIASPRPSTATLHSDGRHGNVHHADATLRAHPRSWETEIEGLLKEIYAAVKNDQIRLPSSDAHGRNANGLSPSLGTGARKKGGATNGSDRVAALKRGSIRGLQGLLGGTQSNPYYTEPSSSSTNIATNNPRNFGEGWLHASNGGTSSSVSSQASQSAPATIGFASTLTSTIIREAQEEDAAPSVSSIVEEPEDDELALMGPPWAKEGSLTRKHYWEGPGKRAKDKNWTDVFVVVQKGVLSMFKFGDTSSSSSKARNQHAGASGTAMGGGNWLSNATNLGEVSLAHTLANALPPPGYNRNRPHVFALTLPGGAVYFFQAGHEDLVHEWVQTCNYWAARQSKEPLPGGVSNMEYGWNKVMPSEDYEELDYDGDETDATSMAPSSSFAVSVSGPPDGSIYNQGGKGYQKQGDNRSIRSGRSGSGRSMRARAGAALYQNWQDAAALVTPSSGGASDGGSSMYNSPGNFSSPAPSIFSNGGHGSATTHANERMFINEWKAPAAPSMPSTLKEEDQLERCLRHMALIESELTCHNELRQPMLQLYSPKGQNYTKALSNWERKSNHLLQELIKYQSYVESLKNSVKLRAERRGLKEVDSMIRRADEV